MPCSIEAQVEINDIACDVSVASNLADLEPEMDVVIDAGGGGGGANLQTKSVSYTPSETAISASVTPDEGYDGLDKVNVSVSAIPSNYVGSGITRQSSLSVNGPEVTAPAGYYESSATASVTHGTAGTPTATKGAVSNHSISVTPSVTNTTGFILGGTKTGTAVTVSASELVSGDKSITANGSNIDVTNYETVSVSVSGGSSGATTVASGTWTGNNDYTFEISVGDDCPINNFAFFLWADSAEEEFPYDSIYKIARWAYVHQSEIGAYAQGSTSGGYTTYNCPNFSAKINNSGTVTTYTTKPPSDFVTARNGGLNQGAYNSPSLRKYSDKITVYYTRGNQSYKFTSGVKYYWKLIYFGSNYANEKISKG